MESNLLPSHEEEERKGSSVNQIKDVLDMNVEELQLHLDTIDAEKLIEEDF